MGRGRPRKDQIKTGTTVKHTTTLLRKALEEGISHGKIQIQGTKIHTPPAAAQSTIPQQITQHSANRAAYLNILGNTPPNPSPGKVETMESSGSSIGGNSSHLEGIKSQRIEEPGEKMHELTDPTHAQEKAKQWNHLLADNTMASKGMSLKYIAPVLIEGEKIGQLRQDEVDKETEKWQQAVIMYVLGNSPSIAAVERYIAHNWNYIAKPKVFYHNHGYFLVRFASIEDRDEVLYAGPHMLNNKPMIAKAWEAGFDFNKEVLRMVPLWIKLPNRPLNCWSMDSLSRIGSLLGTPIYADECITKVDRISNARMLVEVDITQEVIKTVKVNMLTQEHYDQRS